MTEVSPVLPPDLVALRSRIEERWRIVIQQLYGAALLIESMTCRSTGQGMPRMLDVLSTLSTLPRTVFLKELEESPDSVVSLVKELLALAVSEMGYRVGLDEVLDGSYENRMGGEPGRDTG